MIHMRWWVVLVGVVALIGSVWAVGDRAGDEAAKDTTAAIKRSEKKARKKDALYASQARMNIKRQMRGLYTNICLSNNVFKATLRNDERKRIVLTILLSGGDSDSIALAREGARVKNKLHPILNCKRTFAESGKAVPMTSDQEQKFMTLVRRGKIPILSRDGGRVIGAREPKQGELADF